MNLAPLLAGAGVAGLALAFGAQSLVRDFMTGLFMLIEDQYGVGDVIDVGLATGTVEALSLRTTRLRDHEGVVWHVPNGEVHRVGNMSLQWARAVVDVAIAYESDVDEATDVIERSGRRVAPRRRVLALHPRRARRAGHRVPRTGSCDPASSCEPCPSSTTASRASCARASRRRSTTRGSRSPRRRRPTVPSGAWPFGVVEIVWAVIAFPAVPSAAPALRSQHGGQPTRHLGSPGCSSDP